MNTEKVVEMLLSAAEKMESTEEVTKQDVTTYVQTAAESYVLVEWPSSQLYMEEEWFQEEAILALGCEEQVGSSAYFIPINRIF